MTPLSVPITVDILLAVATGALVVFNLVLVAADKWPVGAELRLARVLAVCMPLLVGLMIVSPVSVKIQLIAAAVGALIALVLFLAEGIREWPTDKKFRLARMFAVCMLLLVGLMIPRALLLVGSGAYLSDPSLTVFPALIAIGLVITGGWLARLLYQSRNL